MAQRNIIEVIIDGTDRASDIIDGFARNLGAAASGVSSFGQQVTSLGFNMTAIGAPFLGLAGFAQAAFAEMDDAADQLDAVLKSTGGSAGVTRQQVLLLGSELQDLTGITRAQIVSGENMLLTFTNIGEGVFPRATRAITDLSVAMKQDIKGSAIQLGKALNDPITGITALTRVGVTFTEQQKEMIKAMVEAGDVAGAQGIILTEIEKEFGGSAEAAVDPIDHMRTAIQDLAIDIGVSLQPVLDEIIPTIVEIVHSISQWFTAMSDSGDNTVGILLAIGAGFAIIGPILAVIGTTITAIGGLFTFLLGPVGLLIAGIAALFVAFQTNFLGIQTILQPILDWIKLMFGDVFYAIGAGVPIVDILRVLLYRLLPPEVAQGIVDGITAITTFINGLITEVTTFVTEHPNFVNALLLIGGVIAGVSLAATILTTAVGFLSGALAFLFSPIVLVVGALIALLAAIDSGYPGGIPGAINDAATAAQQLWFIFTFYLNQAVGTIRIAFDLLKLAIQYVMDKITEFTSNVASGLNGITGIIDLLASGQIDLGDVFSAVGAEFTGGGNPNPPQFNGAAGTSSISSTANSTTINFNGTGGPTNQGEANNSANMISSAMQNRGVVP